MAEQGRPEAEFDSGVIEARGLGRSQPGRIADGEAVHRDMWLPMEQIHLQIAQDLDLPAIAMAEIAGYRRPHQIPVQKIKRDDRRDQKRNQDREGPAGKSRPGEGKIPEIPNYLAVPDMMPAGRFRVPNQGHSAFLPD